MPIYLWELSVLLLTGYARIRWRSRSAGARTDRWDPAPGLHLPGTSAEPAIVPGQLQVSLHGAPGLLPTNPFVAIMGCARLHGTWKNI